MPSPCQLSPSEQQQIQQWIAAHGTPQQVALRCRIVLASSQGLSDVAITKHLSVNRKTVLLWRQLLAQQRLDGLWEIAPGRGRKPRYGSDKIAAIVDATLQTKPKAMTHWSCRTMATRRAWTRFARKGYGLANIAAFLDIEFRHHDAVEDARAAGSVLLRAIGDTGLQIHDWLKRIEQPIDPTRLARSLARSGNPDGPLAGEVIAFTGALSMPRREAVAVAASAGCDVESGVTQKITLLVVGDQNLRKLAGHQKSSKHRKAEKLIAAGQQIRILGERDFCELVKANWSPRSKD